MAIVGQVAEANVDVKAYFREHSNLMSQSSHSHVNIGSFITKFDSYQCRQKVKLFKRRKGTLNESVE